MCKLIHSLTTCAVLAVLSASAAASPGCPTIAEVQPPPNVVNGRDRSFAAFNFRDRLIRHSNFEGWLTPPTTQEPPSGLTQQDASFSVNDYGLCRPGIGCATLTSWNYGDRFIRHNFFRIKLHHPDVARPAGTPSGPDTGFGSTPTVRDWWHAASEVFRKDTSWEVVPGLAGEGVSFRSVNFPDRYLRHRNFELWLDPLNDQDPDAARRDLFRKDATFCAQPPLAGWSFGPR